MKQLMAILFAFATVAPAFDVEDIRIPKRYDHQCAINTSAEWVIAFYHEEMLATAFSTKKDEEITLRLPEIEGIKHLWIRYGTLLPDGYALAVPDGKISDGRSDAVSEIRWVIYFFDKKGEFTSRTVLKDLEIFAMAPWGADTLAVAYGKPPRHQPKGKVQIGLAAMDRKGEVVKELIEPVVYEEEKYRPIAIRVEGLHQLYREPDGLVYWCPSEGQVITLDGGGRVTRKLQARLDRIPGEKPRWLMGFFSIGGKNVFRMMTENYTGKVQKWVDGEDINVLVPGNRTFVFIHRVGDDYYKSVGSEDGNFRVLRKITSENWEKLTR